MQSLYDAKTQENSKAIANNTTKNSNSTSSFSFIDDNPVPTAQLKLQEAMDNPITQFTGNSSAALTPPPFSLTPIQQKSSNGMPEPLQLKMENAFGWDFSDVAIHQNSQKATQLNARAYTQGTDIHFSPNEYNPTTPKGQELIGHELTHVVQQKQGRVQPTIQSKGVAINDDKGLEQEADEMGKKASKGGGIQLKKIDPSHKGAASIVQKAGNNKGQGNQLKSPLFKTNSKFAEWSGLVLTVAASGGAYHSYVAIIQDALQRLGFFKNDIPKLGFYDNITSAAVKSFQQRENISGDGFGIKTLIALDTYNFSAQTSKGIQTHHPLDTSLRTIGHITEASSIYNTPDTGQKKKGHVDHKEKVQIEGRYTYNKAWVYVRKVNGQEGWMRDYHVDFIASNNKAIVDNETELYKVQKGDSLIKIVNQKYKVKIEDASKMDKRLYVNAIIAVNEDRKAIYFDNKEQNIGVLRRLLLNEQEEQAIKNFMSAKVKSQHHIFLPSTATIAELKKQNIIASGSVREKYQAVIDFLAFYAGIQVGQVEGVYQAIKGIFEDIVGIGKLIGDLISTLTKGELWKTIKELGENIVKMVEQIPSMFQDMWKDFAKKTPFQKGRAIGNIIGQIVFEIALAILTAGVGTAAKAALKGSGLAAKLARKGSNIAAGLNKMADKMPKFNKKDRDLINNKKDSKKHREKEKDRNEDDATQKRKALIWAKTITETNDRKDTPVSILNQQLEAIKLTYKAVKAYDILPNGTPGQYKVIQREKIVKNGYTPDQKKEKELAKLKGKWNDWTEKEVESYYTKMKGRDDIDLSANSPDHKAQRWEEYKNKPGTADWKYERWSKQYHNNMSSSKRILREDHYRTMLGKEAVKPTQVKTPYSRRSLDIHKKGTKKYYEVKTGKEYLTKSGKLPNETTIKKDAWLTKKQGYKITWILEQGASEPLLKALKKAKIDYVIGKPKKLD